MKKNKRSLAALVAFAALSLSNNSVAEPIQIGNITFDAVYGAGMNTLNVSASSLSTNANDLMRRLDVSGIYTINSGPSIPWSTGSNSSETTISAFYLGFGSYGLSLDPNDITNCFVSITYFDQITSYSGTIQAENCEITPDPDPGPSPDPTPDPDPVVTSQASISAPNTLELFDEDGFRGEEATVSGNTSIGESFEWLYNGETVGSNKTLSNYIFETSGTLELIATGSDGKQTTDTISVVLNESSYFGTAPSSGYASYPHNNLAEVVDGAIKGCLEAQDIDGNLVEVNGAARYNIILEVLPDGVNYILRLNGVEDYNLDNVLADDGNEPYCSPFIVGPNRFELDLLFEEEIYQTTSILLPNQEGEPIDLKLDASDIVYLPPSE